MDKLAELFNRQLTHAHYEVVSQIYNCKMAQGTPVMDHIMKMINLFENLESMGTSFDLQYKTNVILSSLLSTFAPFRMSYKMTDEELELTKLANALVEAEKALKKDKSEINATDVKPSSNGKKEKR
ncbi:uncharacterized protein LOC122638761 [Telopea speciosissima]|uniref:uncharacterized protein LOC122638761 n=1 Tax=Telopea speciosissima TaxID=54955 RepID=UPI001CC63198|nr:uncharacterized protein LOC122638761 [Telopea speciosissima]